MSLDAQDWVWTHSKSKGTARLVLLAIADKASGPDCSAYAGTTMLVQRSNAARSSVIVAVDKLLESKELATVEDRKGPKGETVYSLPLAIGHVRSTSEGGPDSGPLQKSDRSGIRTPGGPKSVPPRSENRTPTGPDSAPHNADNAEKPKTNTEKTSLAEHHLEAFGAFWLTYPKKKDREEAKKSWVAALKRGANPEHIVEAAQAYARERAGKDPQYTKYPTTWLNKGCYDDEPDPAPSGLPQLRSVPGAYGQQLTGTDAKAAGWLELGAKYANDL
ncbi:hypothetical protein ACWD5B_28975 [Streptomyces tanashiensis]